MKLNWRGVRTSLARRREDMGGLLGPGDSTHFHVSGIMKPVPRTGLGTGGRAWCITACRQGTFQLERVAKPSWGEIIAGHERHIPCPR
jgi:hypothetical protein